MEVREILWMPECLRTSVIPFAQRSAISPEASFAQVNGVRIAYESRGKGYPLLMLHGFPRTHHVWDKVRPGLEGRFTVVTPDRRGYGESDRPTDPDAYGNAANAADDLALMDHLGFDRFMVVGHDRGAPVAQLLAADQAERVSGALIIDATPQGLDRGPRRDPSGRGWYLDFFRQRGVAEQL
ncbi:MAG: alpha/beta fold hydrolase, partial [Dehalococcoidia bacterium]